MKAPISIVILLLFSQILFAENIGEFIYVRGKIYKLAGENKKEILKGDKVDEKDIYLSDKNSIARIKMTDSNIVDIYPSSKFEIKSYIYKPFEDKNNVRLNIEYGKIKMRVNQKYDGQSNQFNVDTPVVTAGVRGTIFSTAHDQRKNLSEVVTDRGLVEVTKLSERGEPQGRPVPVRPDQRLLVDTKNSQLEAKDLSSKERKNLDRADERFDSDKSDKKEKSENQNDDVKKEISDHKRGRQIGDRGEDKEERQRTKRREDNEPVQANPTLVPAPQPQYPSPGSEPGDSH